MYVYDVMVIHVTFLFYYDDDFSSVNANVRLFLYEWNGFISKQTLLCHKFLSRSKLATYCDF